jgi:hypothetical protein
MRTILGHKGITKAGLKLYELSPNKRSHDTITHSIDSVSVINDPSEKWICELPTGCEVFFDKAYTQPSASGSWSWLEGRLMFKQRIIPIEYYIGCGSLDDPYGHGRVFRYIDFPTVNHIPR